MQPQRLTKADIDRIIRDAIGEQLADFRREMEEQSAARRVDLRDILAGATREPDAGITDPEKGRGLKIARYIRALAAGKGNARDAAEIVKGWDKPGDAELSKALSESILSAGGAIVPDEFVADLIELLRARAVIRASGAVVVPMNSGSMTIPKQTAAGTAAYTGENVNIASSQQVFGQIQLSAKKLAALTPVSNDLIRDATPQADVIVRDDLVAIMSLREDLAFIRDDGTANTPKGIRNFADAANIFAATQAGAIATVAEVTDDLAKMVRQLEDANIPFTRPGWLLTPRSKWFLMSRRDANSNLVFEPEMRTGMLLGWPFRTTTQIPNNLGAGTNESEVYFVDFSQALIAENSALEVEIQPGAAYFDGTTVISAFSQDQTVIRTIARHDFALRHPLAASVLTTVKWGA